MFLEHADPRIRQRAEDLAAEDKEARAMLWKEEHWVADDPDEDKPAWEDLYAYERSSAHDTASEDEHDIPF